MVAKFLLSTSLIALLLWPLAALTHDDMGRLTKPIALENVDLRLHDGRETDLHSLTEGKVTALQLIFTTCTTVCPIQGATFGLFAEHMKDETLPFQLLSISIDANYDTPEDLATWKARHYDGPGWTLGVTDFMSTQRLVDNLMTSISGNLMDDSPVPSSPDQRPSETDHHGANVVFIGPDGRIIYRSYDYPSSDVLHDILRELSDTVRD